LQTSSLHKTLLPIYQPTEWCGLQGSVYEVSSSAVCNVCPCVWSFSSWLFLLHERLGIPLSRCAWLVPFATDPVGVLSEQSRLYMFRTVRLSIIRSLFTVHSAMVYVIQVCRQLFIRIRMAISSILVLLQFHPGPAAVPFWSCSKAVYKPVWHTPLLSVQGINCWWWTEELSKTCRVSCQNKFVKLVHLVGLL
jgi:hypothetical protein